MGKHLATAKNKQIKTCTYLILFAVLLSVVNFKTWRIPEENKRRKKERNENIYMYISNLSYGRPLNLSMCADSHTDTK